MQRGRPLGRGGRSREHHDVEVVERLVVRRVERRLRRSHGDDELEPELRREQPGLERQLLGGGPGDRLGRQRGHEHRQHLHLQHGRPECGGDLPGQCHHLWDQLEREHHRHGGGQRRGDSLGRGGGPREHHDFEVVERLVVQRVERRLRRSPAGTTSWSLGFAGSNLVSSDSYSVVAQATDTYGNVGTSTAKTFTYGARPPRAWP